MIKGLSAQRPQTRSPGRRHKLSIENQALVALEYWREYRTYFHIATDIIQTLPTLPFRFVLICSVK